MSTTREDDMTRNPFAVKGDPHRPDSYTTPPPRGEREFNEFMARLRALLDDAGAPRVVKIPELHLGGNEIPTREVKLTPLERVNWLLMERKQDALSVGNGEAAIRARLEGAHHALRLALGRPAREPGSLPDLDALAVEVKDLAWEVMRQERDRADAQPPYPWAAIIDGEQVDLRTPEGLARANTEALRQALLERDAARRETADIRARLIGAGMTPSIPVEVDLSGPQVTATERELSTLEMVDALLEHVTVLRKQVHDLKGANRDLARQTEQQTPDLLTRIRQAVQHALDGGSHMAAAKLLELEARLTSGAL